MEKQERKEVTYAILSVVGDAVVKVPDMITNPRLVPNGREIHSIPACVVNGIPIPKHYKHGFTVQGGPTVNIHYYGLDYGDFGQRIVAVVKVIRKTLPDGRKFIHLDVYRKSTMTEYLSSEKKSEGIPKLKILNVSPEKRKEGDIRIHWSDNGYIRFEEYVPRQKTASI